MHHSRSKQLPDLAVRYLAWFCLFLTLWPAFVVAAQAPSAVPVVTKISGAVSVRGSGGSRDILSSQIIHSGDMLMTGVDSLAVVSLADVGKVRLGPASTVTATATATSLLLHLASGSLCVEAQSSAVTVDSGSLAVSAGDGSAIFNLMRDSASTKIAVYRGQISAGSSGKKSIIVRAGEALVALSGGNSEMVPIATVQPDFVSLKCPDDAIVADAVPTPGAAPSPTVSSGGGGGGGGILGILLGVAGLAALAGGHGGGGGSQPTSPPPPVPSPSPSPSPGSLILDTNALSFLVGGGSQSFNARESAYSGPIAAMSGDTNVATVSGSGNGPGPVLFTVTPGAAGSTNIVVTDNHGGSQNVSITVTPPGALSVNPPTMQFLVGGATQTFNARESAYSGPIAAMSGDTNIATVSGSGNGPGPVLFTVTPGAAGSTNIVVTDNHGGSQNVSVTIVGPLSVNPTTLTFLGTTTSQTFDATDPNYTGSISAAIAPAGIATVVPVGSTIGPGPVRFRVTPLAAGNATITVSDASGGATTVGVSVSTGALTINPRTLTFTVGGPTQTFTASEADYGHLINATSSQPSQATVTPASGTGPTPAPFTVAALAAGNPTIAITDDHGGLLFLDVTITGPIDANPTTLTFDGTTDPKPISVSDPNYFGSINANSSDLSVATVDSPHTGPNATFSVTPVSRGSATISFSDANLGSGTVSVQVNSGPLTVSTSAVTITLGGGAGFTGSETDYTGPIKAVSSATGVATVSPASGAGPGPVSFTITAVSSGTADVTVTDNHGGSRTVNVTVLQAPTVSPPSLTFTDVGTPSPVSVTENNYTGTFSIVSNTCATLATVGPVSGPGPSASIPVTPLNTTASGGTCSFRVQDDVHGLVSAAVSVTVGPFGTITPTPTSLSFSDIGAGAAKTFTISETNYTGNFTIDASACSAVATVAPLSGTSSTTFTVTPNAAGGPCNLSITDDHANSAATIAVTVGPFGTITPTPASLSFSDIGAGAAKTFTVAESGYTGSFTIDASACSAVASVAPLSGTGSTTFTVTPNAAGGPCNLSITDDHASTAATIAVTVGPFGAVVPNPTNFNLAVGGSTGTFTVSETGYTGNFTINDSACSSSSIASVSPGSGTSSQTFTVTSGTTASNCAVVVTDDHGGTAKVFVFVTSGSLTVSPTTLSFASPTSPSQNFTASDFGLTDVLSANTSNVLVANVLCPTPPCMAPSATFSVVPIGNGTASITVTDTHGGQAVVSVGVGVPPLVKKRPPIDKHKPPAPIPTPIGAGGPGSKLKGPPQHEPAGPPRPGTSIGPVRPISPGLPGAPLPGGPHLGPGGPQGLTPGPLMVSAMNLLFRNAAGPQTLAVTEVNYGGMIMAMSSNANVAVVAAPPGAGPMAAFTIVPKGPGSALIRITDDHGGLRLIVVTVQADQRPPLSPQRPAPVPHGGRPQ